MGWFSDIFTPETLLPIAAGALTGGAGFAALAAGAGTGAGIAALKGDDILAGAVGGGLGGMTGGSLSSAFGAGSAGAGSATSGAAKGATQGATQGATTGAVGTQGATVGAGVNNFADPFGPAASIQNVGLPAPGMPAGNMTQSGFEQGLSFIDSSGLSGSPGSSLTQSGFEQGLNLGNNSVFGSAADSFRQGNYGDALVDAGTGFKQGLSNFGGGGKYGTAIGAGKLASTGLGLAGMAGLDQTPMTMEEDDRGKYDPNATLNLSGDSGLRLIASGGYIGKRNYAGGGYLEGGPAEGDGMSDDIPATIDETQPAALSEGEFVIPADVVAFAGNGSSDAGARRFYEMMEQIRRDATGRPEQIREIELEEYIPIKKYKPVKPEYDMEFIDIIEPESRSF